MHGSLQLFKGDRKLEAGKWSQLFIHKLLLILSSLLRLGTGAWLVSGRRWNLRFLSILFIKNGDCCCSGSWEDQMKKRLIFRGFWIYVADTLASVWVKILVTLKLPPHTESKSLVITYLRTELSPSWEAANCPAIKKIPSNFKEPEGSSPCSQEPVTGPYPEPVQSSPYHPVLSLQDPF
jgi:hypothetical protein